MNRWLGLQFIFYCDYLKSRYEFFNLIKADVFKSSIDTEKEVENKLKTLKMIDLEFVKLIQLIRDYFKWMLLLSITMDVVDITMDVSGGFDNKLIKRKILTLFIFTLFNFI